MGVITGPEPVMRLMVCEEKILLCHSQYCFIWVGNKKTDVRKSGMAFLISAFQFNS